jgi:hypothetical protein
MRRRGESFGIPETGQLLRLARSIAGFTSAKSAALKYGWSEPTMRAHESGTRRIGYKEAEKYASAFGITVEAFRADDQARTEIETLRSNAYGRGVVLSGRESAATVGARLKLARKVRGFARAFDFGMKYGFVLSTLGSHEAGINTISERMAEAYAEALGISSTWLLRGTLPSKLGLKADDLLSQTVSSVEIDANALARIADPPPEIDLKMVTELIDAAKAKRAAGNSDEDEIFEVQQSSIVGPADASRRLRSWKLPKGLLQSVFGASANDTVLLALQYPVHGMDIGDRVLIDTSRRDPTAGGEFAYSEAGGHTVFRKHSDLADSSGHSGYLLGKVVARIMRVRD